MLLCGGDYVEVAHSPQGKIVQGKGREHGITGEEKKSIDRHGLQEGGIKMALHAGEGWS